ncbi:tetratricopeptide repeat protein [Oceaniglobus indicus]|uniref:tetratricopeptide repeat protein n=1 Tax=Oceaniglobus indicus TaxID=2047749 RepID=UPI000C18BB4E|nr:tetratricopeptide repeat protein [Oceaniglobus indicus]
MARTAFAILSMVLLLAACGNIGGLLAERDPSPFAPDDVPRGAESVDGLLVGHRLMAAREYELALKAYYRAAAQQGTTVDVLSAIGSANLKLGRLGQAERILRRAVEVDETFVPAWNNLGVVLMERRKFPEAERVFRTAFALDSGESDDIRANLALALAKIGNPTYTPDDNSNFALVRRGTGEYLILSKS